MGTKTKKYHCTALSSKRKYIHAAYGIPFKEDAIEHYKAVAAEIEENEGLSQNIESIWELRPNGDRTLMCEKIECCDGDVIILSLTEYETEE